MEKMNFTDEQRLLLSNQYEILKHLDNENADIYDKNIEILREGFEFHYDDLFDGFSTPVSEDDSRFVLDVLNMYRDINFSKRKLDESLLNELDGETLHFRGFDYNDDQESRLASYAEFYIKKLDTFRELIADPQFESFNSHWPNHDRYHNMLVNYELVKNSGEYEFGELTLEQILNISK